MIINYTRKISIFIAVVGLIALFAAGIPNNLLLKLTAAEEYNNIHSEYENMYQNLNMKSIYEENQIYLLNKINELNIDTEILQDKIINGLSKLSRKNNIQLGNIKFSEPMPISEDNSKYSKEEWFESLQENSAICMKVNVDFDSDFDDMLIFIDNIKNSSTEISVIDINILMSDNQKTHTVLNLMFYALPINGR